MHVLLFAVAYLASVTTASTGKWFDKFVIVVLENRDLSSVLDDSYFKGLASSGILHTNYHAVTHPSQPNYWALIAGAYSFSGLTFAAGQKSPVTVSTPNGDGSYDIYTTDTVVDLLEAAGLDYKIYSENYPTPGSCYFGSSYGNETAIDIANFELPGPNPMNRAYERKHNPFISFKTFTDRQNRCKEQRDFNDMNRDIMGGHLPSFTFVVPNQAHDGHDTTVHYSGTWLKQFIQNITSGTDYKRSRVLVHIVYDESDASGNGNQVYSVIFGSALSKELVGFKDDTFYSHFSTLATLEANWNLGNLAKEDVGAAVFKLSMPTASTSAQSAATCQDRSTAHFRVGKDQKRRSCSLLRSQTHNWVSRYCNIYKRVAKLCPQTCKAC